MELSTKLKLGRRLAQNVVRHHPAGSSIGGQFMSADKGGAVGGGGGSKKRALEEVEGKARLGGSEMENKIKVDLKTDRGFKTIDLVRAKPEDWKEQTIGISDLRTQQSTVGAKTIKKYIKSKDAEPPEIIKKNGIMWVEEGNHRINADIFLGKKTIKAKILDLDKKPTANYQLGRQLALHAVRHHPAGSSKGGQFMDGGGGKGGVKLTDKEMGGVDHWLQSASVIRKHWDEDSRPLIGEHKESAEQFEKALEKMPNHSGTIYRGTSFSKEEIDDMVKKQADGSSLEFKAPLSFTDSEKSASAFKSTARGEIKTTIVAKVSSAASLSSIDTSKLSYPNQSKLGKVPEIVSRPGTTYRILKVERRGKSAKVFIEESKKKTNNYELGRRLALHAVRHHPAGSSKGGQFMDGGAGAISSKIGKLKGDEAMVAVKLKVAESEYKKSQSKGEDEQIKAARKLERVREEAKELQSERGYLEDQLALKKKGVTKDPDEALLDKLGNASSSYGNAKPPFPTGKAPYEFKEADKGMKMAKVEEVSLSKLRATQPAVEREVVLKYLKNPNWEGDRGKKNALPEVVRKGGKLYIHDGTHRLTADKLKGKKTVSVKVVDLDKRP